MLSSKHNWTPSGKHSWTISVNGKPVWTQTAMAAVNEIAELAETFPTDAMSRAATRSAH